MESDGVGVDATHAITDDQRAGDSHHTGGFVQQQRAGVYGRGPGVGARGRTGEDERAGVVLGQAARAADVARDVVGAAWEDMNLKGSIEYDISRPASRAVGVEWRRNRGVGQRFTRDRDAVEKKGPAARQRGSAGSAPQSGWVGNVEEPPNSLLLHQNTCCCR